MPVGWAAAAWDFAFFSPVSLATVLQLPQTGCGEAARRLRPENRLKTSPNPFLGSSKTAAVRNPSQCFPMLLVGKH